MFQVMLFVVVYGLLASLIGYGVYWFHPSRGSRFGNFDAVMIGGIVGALWPALLVPAATVIILSNREHVVSFYHRMNEKKPDEEYYLNE